MLFEGEQFILKLKGEEVESIRLEELANEYMELMAKYARIKYERDDV